MLSDPKAAAFSAAEASLKKCFGQFLGQSWIDLLPAERIDIHIIVFNSLVGGEYIVYESACTSAALFAAVDAPHSACRRTPPHDQLCRQLRPWA
jgi:hypothetical protein